MRSASGHQSRSMLRIELARSVEQFENQVRGRCEAVRASLQIDFAFIAAYWLVFATMGAFLGSRGFWGADWLGGIVGELATVAAVADAGENVYALHLLRRTEGLPGDESPGSVATWMRRSSLIKWTSVFAASGLLSIMFFQRGGWNSVLGVAYVLAAALGLATVTAEATRLAIGDLWLEWMLRTAFFGVGLALVLGLPVAASQL
jgi:hypothetical protein